MEDIFKEEEVEKEDKTKAVLQLDHATSHEEDDTNYEMPPIELMSMVTSSRTYFSAGSSVSQDRSIE